MKCEDQGLQQSLEQDLRTIAETVRAVAHRYRGDSYMLLIILRALEQWHREIRDDLFQNSIPNNRQALHALLRDMEEAGGWPYIERMRLRELMTNLIAAEMPSDRGQDE